MKIPAGGFDISKEILDNIKDGELIAAVDQQPYSQGFYAVTQLALYLKYGLYPSEMDTGGTGLVDKTQLPVRGEVGRARPLKLDHRVARQAAPSQWLADRAAAGSTSASRSQGESVYVHHPIRSHPRGGGAPRPRTVRDQDSSTGSVAQPEGGIAVLFVLAQVVCVIAALLWPDSFRYLSDANIAVTLKAIAPLGVMALGVGVLMIAGEYDLSVGALYSFLSIVCATLSN